MSSSKSIGVFKAIAAYSYKETEGRLAGQMVEHHIEVLFKADTLKDGVESAILWARERQKNCMSVLYPGSFFSSLKVSIKHIGTIAPDGCSSTRSGGTLFEWKYDAGYNTPESALESAVRMSAEIFSQRL